MRELIGLSGHQTTSLKVVGNRHPEQAHLTLCLLGMPLLITLDSGIYRVPKNYKSYKSYKNVKQLCGLSNLYRLKVKSTTALNVGRRHENTKR